MDLNECISTQDGAIVIIVLIFYDLLTLMLSEDSCKERGFVTDEVGQSDRQGESTNPFFKIRSVV